MSPLAVSQYLPRSDVASDTFNFDVVIFDEASQVYPWDAVPAIIRANQTILAGDQKQLPPTSFWRRSSQDDDDLAMDDDNDDASATYTTQVGHYTKIGRVVYYSFRIHMTATTGLEGAEFAKIGGLPFAPSSASFGGGGALIYMAQLNLSTDTPIMFMTEGTSPELAMYQTTATAPDAVLISEVSANGLIQAAGHYMTAT